MFGAETRDAGNLLQSPLLLYPSSPHSGQLSWVLAWTLSFPLTNLQVQQTAKCPLSAWFRA